MCSCLAGGMAEVLKYRHNDIIAYVNAFVVLQIHGKARNQSVWTNLFQVRHGFMVLFIEKKKKHQL